MPTPLLAPPRAGVCANRVSIPLEHVSIRAEIRGVHARVSCAQRYRNKESRPIEAVYVFPIDEGAAVCGFAAVVNGVRYEGAVKPREQAFEQYDDAMADGHGAFLLDEERPDVFTASLGNLMPGSDVQIELTYVTALFEEGDSIRFTLPTTVAPRYAPPEDRVGVGQSPAEQLNPPRQHEVPYGLSFSASIVGSTRVRRVESPSHPIAIELDGDRATVSLAQQDAALDRDVVLLIATDDVNEPHVSFERATNGQIAAALTFRPSFGTERQPSDVVFLVDRSGSMQGSSIEQVRNALQLCLRSLDDTCRFNIVGFGSSFESLFHECRQYDQRSLAEASSYAASLGATLGGTDILPALEFALERSGHSRRVLQLVVMTDGEVTNSDAVLEAVRQRAGQVRVFTFGIGRGASHHLVKGLARVGKGAAEFVYPGERIEAKVVRQFRRALAPALTNITIDWSGVRATTIAGTVGAVFADEPLRVYALIDDLHDGSVTLRAEGPDGPLSWSMKIDPATVVDGTTLGILAARSRIRELEEGQSSPTRGSRQLGRKDERVVSEIVRLAMEYGLASRETSWVAIEAREVPTAADAVLRRVPIAVTSGWGGEDRTTLAAKRVGASLHDTGEIDVQGLMFERASMPMPTASLLPRAPGWLTRLRSKLSGPPDNTISPFEAASGRMLDDVIALQQADGAWDLDKPLSIALRIPLRDLMKRLDGSRGDQSEARRAFATALALTYLEREWSPNRDEWDMLAAKAHRWLATVAARPPVGESWIDFAKGELVTRGV